MLPTGCPALTPKCVTALTCSENKRWIHLDIIGMESFANATNLTIPNKPPPTIPRTIIIQQISPYGHPSLGGAAERRGDRTRECDVWFCGTKVPYVIWREFVDVGEWRGRRLCLGVSLCCVLGGMLDVGRWGGRRLCLKVSLCCVLGAMVDVGRWGGRRLCLNVSLCCALGGSV